MRKGLAVLWLLLCSITPAAAQVSIGFVLPGASIGINFPVYPELVQVPGYPVYYAPRVSSNLFFYDGLYWVYQRDNWYASSWYNGPWGLVAPEVVPLYVLRVPVRYYRQPPVYFQGWSSNAPPRWGERWGNSWQQGRNGWDNWNRSSVPAPAPLPVYQRQYAGNRYPRAEQQAVIQTQNYRYQPRETVVQQSYQAQRAQPAPAPAPQVRQAATQERSYQQQDQRAASRPPPASQGGPATTYAQPQGAPPMTRAQPQGAPPAPRAQTHPAQQPQQVAAPREQNAPRSEIPNQGAQGKVPAQEARHAQDKGQDKGQDKSQDKGQDKGHDKG
jgi:hypothetical protein